MRFKRGWMKRDILTICQVGDETMSNGDIDRKVYPRRTYQICSIMSCLKY